MNCEVEVWGGLDSEVLDFMLIVLFVPVFVEEGLHTRQAVRLFILILVSEKINVLI
jgi:uncharacterized membrane protein